MYIKSNNIFITLFLTLSIFLGSALSADAATIQILPSASTYRMGDTVKVTVAVSSDTDSINAASATVTFPTDILSLTSISKTGSIMTLWAQDPIYSNTAGTAKFEAVALNGFTGKNGTLITLSFKPKKTGKATIGISTATVLANNGEGTNVLTTKAGATISIGDALTPPPVDAPKIPDTTTPVQTTEFLTITEIKKPDAKSPQATFTFDTGSQEIGQVFDIQIDDLPLIPWTDDGTHVFQTPVLARGTHLIKVKTITSTGVVVTAFSDFTTDNLSQPVITDYPLNIFSGEYMLLKGIADPNTTVVFTITKQPKRFPIISRLTGVTTDTKPYESSVVANDNGEFNYISDEKATSGTYSIYARAQTQGGLQSSPTVPVLVTAHDDIFSRLTLWLTNTLSLVVPLIALLFVFFFIIIYTLTRYKRFKRRIAGDLLASESDVRKRFQSIDADLEEYARLLIKTHASQKLTDIERSTLLQIKQDITATERSISGDIKRTQERLL